MSEHIAGLDYSITGPAVCVHPIDKKWSINNCKFLSVCTVKKNQGLWLNDSISIIPPIKDYSYDIERFHRMAQSFMSFMLEHNVTKTLIEGYAFASRGNTFSIGEATAMMKHLVVHAGMPLESQTPPVFKKYATGKGNSDKQKMYEAFYGDTQVDLLEEFKATAVKVKAPVDNLVDSYWICKYLHEQETSTDK